MPASKSLSHFFRNTQNTTLDNCDREPIHLSQAIQPLGALLIVQPDSQRIVGASDNTLGFFGYDSAGLWGRTLSDLSHELSQEINSLVADTSSLHEVLDCGWEAQHHHHDVVTHISGDYRVIEFLPNHLTSAKVLRRVLRQTSNTCARILQSEHVDQALQFAVDAIQDITGFSRVMVYKFLPDWSGKVLAERLDGRLESFLGLHFPATDIPQQVRQIMLTVPYRVTGTVSDTAVPIITDPAVQQPLDLTWSLLRSVSFMHTAYCRNMGVFASFTSSLITKDKLWGIISAHHPEEKFLPFDLWSMVQEISGALMLRYEQQERHDTSVMITRLRKIERQFAAQVRVDGDIEAVIATLIPTLQRFLGADGFAFIYGVNVHTAGHTPPEAFIQELIGWAMHEPESQDQFQSIELHKRWPPARAHIDTACGVLIQPIMLHRVCQLIWFRAPITRHVEWAGRPSDKSSRDALQPLQPRHSFERWMQEHNDQSAPWLEAELESAREIFKEFLDIIVSQLLLKEENVTLREFAATAAHDIRAPLRGIKSALDIMDEDNFDANVVRETHAMAQKSANRLSELTTSLLDLTLLSNQAYDFEVVSLHQAVESARDLLTAEFEQVEADVLIRSLPLVTGHRALLTRLFLNLLSNSIKYRSAERRLCIEIESDDSAPDAHVVLITDNGIGIRPDKLEQIFKPLERLHSADNIEGTGLGLAICRKVAEIHRGTLLLDSHYQQGARFRLTLPAD